MYKILLGAVNENRNSYITIKAHESVGLMLERTGNPFFVGIGFKDYNGLRGTLNSSEYGGLVWEDSTGVKYSINMTQM